MRPSDPRIDGDDANEYLSMQPECDSCIFCFEAVTTPPSSPLHHAQHFVRHTTHVAHHDMRHITRTGLFAHR